MQLRQGRIKGLSLSHSKFFSFIALGSRPKAAQSHKMVSWLWREALHTGDPLKAARTIAPSSLNYSKITSIWLSPNFLLWRSLVASGLCARLRKPVRSGSFSRFGKLKWLTLLDTKKAQIIINRSLKLSKRSQYNTFLDI